MSAIYGIYDLKGKKINIDEFAKLKNGFSKYTFEKEDKWIKNNIALGCSMQIITKENENEQIPYFNNEDGIAITADAIIDNREELIRNLAVNDIDITDSQLIGLSYKKWGEECVNHLLGDYSFAIYDEKNQRLFIVRDHVGKRSLYYYLNNNKFIFSTTINPLKNIIKNININEKWLIDYFSIEGAISTIDIEETIYQEINELPPAHYMIVDKNGVKKEKYWFPEKIKTKKLKSDEEYINEFKKIYFEAVSCRLRCDGKIGVMLSSGLDSTSVAAISARELAKSNNELESFTWRPIEGFKSNLSNRVIYDEKDLVQEFLKDYPNINSHYYRCENSNSYSSIDKLLDIFEQPYKMVENAYWVNEITDHVKEENCKVLLDGQFGNFTISKGNIMTYLYSLSKQFKFKAINEEINNLCSAYNGNKKIVRKNIAKKIIKSNSLVNCMLRKKYKYEKESLANEALRKKWHTDKRLKKIGLSIDDNKILDDRAFKKYLTNFVLYSHMGNIETCMSLEKNMLRRDPTRDKRVIEFCLSLPQNQYVRKGRERILIRRATEGIVSDSIRLNYISRGRQSLDWIDKIQGDYRNIKEEILHFLNEEYITKYINTDYLMKLLNMQDIKNDNGQIRHLMIILVWIKYIEKEKNYLQKMEKVI